MARRRATGEGTIYRRKDGRYEGAVYLLTTSGTRKRVRVYGRTRHEAHEKLLAAKAKAQQGILVAGKAWKLGDYLDYWLDEVIKPVRRPSTYERYESTVRLSLKPELGNQPLTRLTIPLLQSYLNQQLANGCTLRKVQMIREVISSALTNAMREEVITRNVARLVVLPGRQRGDVRPWSAEEAVRFLEVAQSHWLYPAFVLLLLYGMRRGEALGLRWQDVDFARGVLRIRQQVHRAGGLVREGPLKTAAGQRDLPLVDLAYQNLWTYWTASGQPDGGLVFTRRDSRQPLEPFVLSRSFQQLCTRHHLRVIRLHDLRHTTATALKRLGVPARDVQLILGHSNIVTTQQIYQHDDMESRREGLGKLERVLTVRAADTNLIEPGSWQPVDGYHRVRVLPSKLPSKSNLLGSVHDKWHQARTDLMPSTSVIEALTWANFGGDPKGNRTPVAGMKTMIEAPVHDRITEVNQVMNERRRHWLLGVVAVNVAVN